MDDPFRTGTAKMKSLGNKAGVAQRQRIARRQLSTDFPDHAREWRRIFAEIWGTFLLVVVAAGGEVVASRSGGAVTPGMRAVAPGLMVMAIIYFMGAVSGAHLNPAVTLAFAVRQNFPWSRVPGYVLGQVVGGVLAALFLRVMFGTVAALGATVPGSCASPKLHPVEKLNRRLDILTVKSRLDRPNRASWKAMKTQADGILARHTSGEGRFLCK